jgi:uncharacterized membrane protein YvlD (DUF360 family)
MFGIKQLKSKGLGVYIFIGLVILYLVYKFIGGFIVFLLQTVLAAAIVLGILYYVRKKGWF